MFFFSFIFDRFHFFFIPFPMLSRIACTSLTLGVRIPSLIFPFSSIRSFSDVKSDFSETKNTAKKEEKKNNRHYRKKSQFHWSGSICIKAQVYKDKDDENDSFIGITSNDCVVRIKKVLNRHDIGHGGTLDKNAEGILPIAVGSATKLLQVC